MDVAPGSLGVPMELVQSQQRPLPCQGIARRAALGPRPWSPVDAGSRDAADRGALAAGGNCGIPLPGAGCWQGWTLLAAIPLGRALAWGGQEAP